MKRRYWKFALVLLVPLVLHVALAGHKDEPSRTIRTYAAEPRWLQFSPDGRTLIFPDDELYICDVTTLKQKAVMETVSSPCFIENGKYLAASGGDERVQIFSMPEGKLVASGPKHFDPVGVLADNSTLIGRISTNGDKQKLFRWNWRSDRTSKLFLRLSVIPEGRLRLMSNDATLTDGKHFWDLKGKLRFKTPQDSDVESQLYNPSSFIALNDGKRAQIWNCKTGKRQGSIPFGLSSGNVTTVLVSPDGTLLAGITYRSRANTPNVNLWDIKSKRLLREIEVPHSTSGDYRLAFSPDGRTLAVAIASAINLWRIK